jgi:hypothetical protein
MEPIEGKFEPHGEASTSSAVTPDEADEVLTYPTTRRWSTRRCGVTAGAG